MTGDESLMQTMAAAGIEVCFANPGTSDGTGSATATPSAEGITHRWRT